MGLRTAFSGLIRFLAVSGGDDALTEKARQVLVQSLYARPTTLAIGAINGVVSSTLVAFLADRRSLYALAFLMSAIALMRLVNAIHLSKLEGESDVGLLEFAYKLGAFSYALTLGVFAAMTVAMDLGAMTQALMIANALGYGIGICAHNAARPQIALGQLVLVSVPVLIAAAFRGTPAAMLLAINIALLFPAMFGITYSVFRVLRESIGTAERSAELARQMERRAYTDEVTGLANRAGLNRLLADKLALERDAYALFWVDLDRFKEVNDLYGHQAGDALLLEIGKRLSKLAGPQAIVARFGGDEFVVARPVQDRRAAQMLASAMLAEITRPARIKGERLEIEASIGLAMAPENAVTAETLMQCADLALFEAKTDGRNQVRFFAESMTRQLAHRCEIEAELRMALRRDELSVYFQPIVDLQSGKVRCFEALVRWFHPTKGEIAPDVFIPIAEECGAIVTLGNWLTGQAARAAARWPEDVRIAVNLSPMQIKAPGAALGILAAIREAQLAPHRLELEVTENLFLEDSPNTAAFVAELTEAGVNFVLDDFGTGYSSLGYINQWPFTKIKIDRSFVSGPKSGRKSDAIIRAVSQMAESLGMEIVAEGLETVEQVQAVRAAGCTLGQGYHFSRAIPDYQAALLLAEERGADGDQLAARLAG